jgi:hypothetical protein
MIKKSFLDFIKESYRYDDLKESTIENIGDDLYEENKDFFSKFHSFINSLCDDVWFSNWSQISKRGTRVDSEEIWYDIDKNLKIHNLSMGQIKENRDIIFQNIDTYSSIGAVVDILLYNLDNTYEVSGSFHDTSPEEAFVKYSYGYHETTYGRIYIKQCWGSISDYYDLIFENLLKQFVIEHGFYTKDIFKELKEEGELIINNNGVVRILFDRFFYIMIDHLTNKDYDNFKKMYKNWISSKFNIEYDDIIDDGDHFIELDFSEIYF